MKKDNVKVGKKVAIKATNVEGVVVTRYKGGAVVVICTDEAAYGSYTNKELRRVK